MDSSFIEGLQQLKRVDAEQAIEAIANIFGSISRMGTDSLIAAHQTISLFKETSSLTGDSLKVIAAFERALTLRAKRVRSECSYQQEKERKNLEEEFSKENL